VFRVSALKVQVHRGLKRLTALGEERIINGGHAVGAETESLGQRVAVQGDGRIPPRRVAAAQSQPR
jgi:hypothetical protein